MTVFDADAYIAAREPFDLKVRGRVYRARPVSAELVIVVEKELASGDSSRVSRALTRLLRAAFPFRWRYVWMGDPVQLFLAQDLATRAEGLRRFFFYLGEAVTVAPATSGTPSPKPISTRGPEPVGHG
jgi:hypothetical protein